MYVGELPTYSNRESFSETFEIADADTGDLLDLSSAVITFELRDPQTKASALLATVGSGITIDDTGIFTVKFTTAQMRGLCAKTYDVGCTISTDGDTENNLDQYIIGTMPVLDGVVS